MVATLPCRWHCSDFFHGDQNILQIQRNRCCKKLNYDFPNGQWVFGQELPGDLPPFPQQPGEYIYIQPVCIVTENQHTSELISMWKMSHKHSNKDPSHQQWLSPAMCVNTRYINSTTGMLLCLCDVFWALINSLECWLCMSALGLILFQTVTVKNGTADSSRLRPGKCSMI